MSGKRRSFYADLDQLRKCFDNVDQGRSGFIGYSELTKLVESMPNTGDSVVSELMEKLDRDRDGKVSFDDFVRLFELERDAASKKQKLNQPEHLSKVIPGEDSNQSCSEAHYTIPTDTYSSYVESSPARANDSFHEANTGEVVLRKNPRRMTMPARLQRHRDLPLLSPIQAERSPATKRPPSNDLTDLASQMKYLTEATDSPKLKRNSKVLSWIESGDMLFEDTGTGLKGEEDLPSPPLSPTYGGDEASHFGSILESVCSTRDISKAAIAKLCEHVKADPQEQQELLALLHHLDTEEKGYVSITEFAQGLQAIKNSVAVGSASTPIHHAPFRRGFSESTPPRLSEPFTPSNQGSKPPPLSSTPMVLPSAKHSSGFLTTIDPNQSGFVKIDDIVNYWQKLGIETPHNQSLENILTETMPVDASGRVSVGELTATLEGSMIVEGKSQNILRQVALKSFKNEITTLRTQIHQISMERDKLKGSLNRTTEEKQKIIAEGDEHVDMITKKSEKEKREQEEKYIDRVKEVEKIKQQEAMHLQERASNAIKDLEAKMKELKGEEEKLREDLKYAQDDVNEVSQQLMLARKELEKKDRTIAILQRDLGSRSDYDIVDDETQMQRLDDLENELSGKSVFINELQDKLRAIQDTCDELKAENERMKQKNLAQKRAMQKSQSLPNTSRSNVMASKKRMKLNRPLSGSHFRRRSMPLNPRIPTSMDLDLAVQQKNHPVLLEEQEEVEEIDFVLPLVTDVDENVPEQKVGSTEESSPEEDTDSSTDSPEDDFTKSTTSLREEFRQERRATIERKRSSDLEAILENERRKHSQVIMQLKEEIFRLEEFSESQQEQALKLEEQRSQISEEARDLRYELESERQSHEVEVNILSRKIENAENDVKKLESSLEQLNEERLQCQQDYEAKLLSAEKKAEVEKSALQSELQYLSSDQSSLQSELLQMKQQLKTQKQYLVQKSSDAMAKLESKYSQQAKTLKSKHDTAIERLNVELSAFQQREETLKDKLDGRSKELEDLGVQLLSLQKRENAFKQQISAFEASEIRYQTEVSQLKDDVSKLQEEISHMKSAATAYKNKISNLKAELQKDASTSFDDFLPLQSSNRRSSSSPESSRHSEIITKMKVQLGELQKVLQTKSARDGEGGGKATAEIELINKLITNSSALDAEVQRMRRGISAERLSHLQVCSQKDQDLRNLQAEKEKESNLVRNLAMAVSQDITSQMAALQSDCSKSIIGCGVKLEEALVTLASISQALKEKDTSHANKLHTLLSDLDQSHDEVSSSKDEISRLQLELEKSHHNLDKLNESQDYLEKLRRDKDAELDELKSTLDHIRRRESTVDRVSNDIVSSRNVKVDADSGQVIAEHEDSQTRDEILLQKEETIHALQREIEQLKQAENYSKLVIEDHSTNRKLIEKEMENKSIIESLQRKVSQLQSELEQQAHKPNPYKEEVMSLQKSLQLAKEEITASKRVLESQHRQAMQEIEEKYNCELSSAHEVIAKNTSEARDFYDYLLGTNTRTRFVPEYAAEFNHSQIMSEAKIEVHKLKEKLIEQEAMYDDLEATLSEKIEEHELLEVQFTTEHEEEVRALRQQKHHLMKKLEESKEHYENILDNQEQENAAMLQELMNRKSDVEAQLTEKTEETFLVYQQVADLSEEKKVLVDIIKQLCIEAGRHIDAVR